ncbi:MAG: hypothetical protein UY48_C0003G0072 [Candidatus Gottesmanbacteria bacterium GW2011_GWB1_49_7]|uniref:Uncharacterized protein n=1 Tax=Candidatus Gottesmanbacteria bacterium GW2011_GWB1_49_7 TaxID=1618448 RepID=A0A0G1W3V5_9BACT|nr:MAG: hypothetical protein UY48_C0003G0072 [Candidatus Gottesmanbacteria bacterium GW2011_GWB1_49_7]
MRKHIHFCPTKHTTYQPRIKEFKCPKCRAKAGDFWTYGAPKGSYEHCVALHDDDKVVCFMCRYETTGRAFAKTVQTGKSLVVCPTCKGKGAVKKK